MKLSKKQKVYMLIFCCMLLFSVIYYIVIKLNSPKEIEILSADKENGSLNHSPKIVVHIKGEVKNPGLIEATSEDRINDIINKAGGATEKADLSSVNLAKKVEDGEEIYIYSIDDKKAPSKSDSIKSSSNSQNGSGESQKVVLSPNKKININTASKQLLEALPSIGPSIAQRIIDYRNEKGANAFLSIDDIKNVSGIGEKTFEKIKNYIDIK